MDILSYLLSKKASEKIVEENAVQSDWNVNDESDPAYVKGRTHYMKPRTVFEEVTTEYSKNNSNLSYKHNETFFKSIERLEGDKTYIVTFDGVKYECVAGSNMITMYGDYKLVTSYVGNECLISASKPDNGAPFYFQTKYQYNAATQVYTPYPGAEIWVKEQGVHTISVADKENLSYCPLDERFIPDTIRRTSDNSDWTISDEADPAYIKNRTHYVSEEYVDKLLIESPSATAKLDSPYDGELKIVVDGVEYNLRPTGTPGGGAPAYLWGNGTVFWPASSGTTVTEHKFGICADKMDFGGGIRMSISFVDGYNPESWSVWDVSQKVLVDVVHELDEKYIPESIARKKDVEDAIQNMVINSSTEGSTKKFKLSIDDSGTITAVEVTD